MGFKLTGQVDESKKAPVARWATKGSARSDRARRMGGSKQPGTFWTSKMQSLGLRLKKGRPRRDRSGAPMRRSG